MKINPAVLLLIFIMFMVGCEKSATNKPLPSSTGLPPSSPGTIAPLPTTPFLSQPSPTMLYSPTSPIPNTPTLTLSPTLDLEDRTAYLLDWLHNTESCPLPCWLGIVPGESTWSELEPLFHHLGAIVVSESKNTYVFHGIGGFYAFGIDIVFELYEQDDRITAIDVHADSWNDATQYDFRAMWESYAPEVIIEDYGCPTQVWILTESKASGDYPIPEQVEYRIWFAYDNLSWEIGYYGKVAYQPVFQLCPTYQEDGNLSQRLRIEIWYPESRNIILNSASNYTARLSIEEASGMSLNEFCNLYIQESEPVCFDTQRDIWP